MEITVTTEPVPLDTSLLEAAEAVLSQQIAPSPFALQADHEFKVAEPAKVLGPVETYNLPVEVYRAVAAQNPMATVPHPLPGTPDSPYRRCSCLAVMPGRACHRCLGTKWLKACPKCEGSGRIDVSRRKGSDRSQPCGHCMTTGQVSANRAEVTRAEEAARATPAVAPTVAAEEAPAFQRSVRLPGIGVTERKKKAKPGRRAKKAAAR